MKNFINFYFFRNLCFCFIILHGLLHNIEFFDYVHFYYFDFLHKLSSYFFMLIVNFCFRLQYLPNSVQDSLGMDLWYYLFVSLKSWLFFIISMLNFFSGFREWEFLTFFNFFSWKVFFIDNLLFLVFWKSCYQFFFFFFFSLCNCFFMFWHCISVYFHSLEYFFFLTIIIFIIWLSFLTLLRELTNFQKGVHSKFIVWFFYYFYIYFFWLFFILSFFFFLELNFFYFYAVENFFFWYDLQFLFKWFHFTWMHNKMDYYWVNFFFATCFFNFFIFLGQWFNLFFYFLPFVKQDYFFNKKVFIFDKAQAVQEQSNFDFFWTYAILREGRWLKRFFYNNFLKKIDEFSGYMFSCGNFPLEIQYSFYLKPYFWIYPEFKITIPVLQNFDLIKLSWKNNKLKIFEWIPLTIKIPGLERNILVYNPLFTKELHYHGTVYSYFFFFTDWRWRWLFGKSSFGEHIGWFWVWIFSFFFLRLFCSLICLLPLIFKETILPIIQWVFLYIDYIPYYVKRYFCLFEFFFVKLLKDFDLVSFFTEHNRRWERRRKFKIYCRTQRVMDFESLIYGGSSRATSSKMKLGPYQNVSIYDPQQFSGFLQGQQGLLFEEIVFDDEFSLWEMFCEILDFTFTFHELGFYILDAYRIGSNVFKLESINREILEVWLYVDGYWRWALAYYFKSPRWVKNEQMIDKLEQRDGFQELTDAFSELTELFYEEFADDIIEILPLFEFFFLPFNHPRIGLYNIFEICWYFLFLFYVIIWSFLIYNLMFFFVKFLSFFFAPFVFYFIVSAAIRFLELYYRVICQFVYACFRFFHFLSLGRRLIIRDFLLWLHERLISEEELEKRKKWKLEDWFVLWNQQEKDEAKIINISFKVWFFFWKRLFLYRWKYLLFLFKFKQKRLKTYWFFFNLILEGVFFFVQKFKNYFLR